jgi:septal ring factor EnvC (AmiA/AmiB activator)
MLAQATVDEVNHRLTAQVSSLEREISVQREESISLSTQLQSSRSSLQQREKKISLLESDKVSLSSSSSPLTLVTRESWNRSGEKARRRMRSWWQSCRLDSMRRSEDLSSQKLIDHQAAADQDSAAVIAALREDLAQSQSKIVALIEQLQQQQQQQEQGQQKTNTAVSRSSNPPPPLST